MDAHRRIFVQARQGIALPGVPFDPLDPFGIHHSKSTASESTTASSSSASVSASASSSITTSASASASVSASGPSSSAPASPSSPAPSPAPNTNSTPPPTSIATGPPSTETVFKTVGPTGSSAAPSISTTPVTDTTQPTGFLQNKVLSGIVFGVVGLIGFTLVIFVATWMLRRRRNKRLVNEAISFDPVNLGKEDYPEDIIEKGRNSPTTGAGAAVGAVGAPSIGNSGHDARSMKSVGSYATGSASHGAPPVSQAPAFADYVPPVPYLNSAPSTPRTQHQFSEQQNQVHNIRGNSVYNPYLGSGYGQSPPPQQPPYAPPHYAQQPGPPAQPSIGYDYGNPVATEGEHARRSSSSMELQFASSGAGRK